MQRPHALAEGRHTGGDAVTFDQSRAHMRVDHKVTALQQQGYTQYIAGLPVQCAVRGQHFREKGICTGQRCVHILDELIVVGQRLSQSSQQWGRDLQLCKHGGRDRTRRKTERHVAGFAGAVQEAQAQLQCLGNRIIYDGITYQVWHRKKKRLAWIKKDD
jgi:hypothetical protein